MPTISQISRMLYCGSRLSATAAFRFFSSTPLGRPPLRPRARAAVSPACVRSNQIALELGQQRKQMKDQLATHGCGIELLLEAPKADAAPR